LNPTTETAPIGVFDSGVGGLSVLREIRRLLPAENLIYVADSAHVPYGEKSREFVEQRAVAITGFLAAQGAKAIVVACNTATSAAISTLRARFALPIVGVEPALKPAAEVTRSGVIGVLATRGTLSGEKLQQLRQRVAANVQVLAQSCEGWVEQVESGDLAGPEAKALVARHVLPLIERGADTLVLGCTHHPFLAPLIREVAGPGVHVIDPAPAVARELKRRMESENLLSAAQENGRDYFLTTGDPQPVSRLITALWGRECEVAQICLPSPGAGEEIQGVSPPRHT
jgi:glutamate racemase